MKRLFGVVLCTGALACTNGPPTPTGTTFPVLVPLGGEKAPSEPPENTPDPDPEPAPKQAYGKLVIEGNYGRCEQTTDYPLDYMSVFLVSEGGSQSRYALYKSAEGVLPCGRRLQVDCTVRDPDPTPGAISSYDLYDAFIGSTTCQSVPPTPPECVDCTLPPPPLCNPPLPRPEGECQLNEQTCTWECLPPPPPPTPECELPGPGFQQFEGGNPWPGPVAECGHFGLVPGPGGFYIAKCGLYFQWGPTFPTTSCTNGQEISHVTECMCVEENQ